MVAIRTIDKIRDNSLIFFLSSDLSSVLDETFLEEANKRDGLDLTTLPIKIKTELLPIRKNSQKSSTNFFDLVILKRKSFYELVYLFFSLVYA